MYMAFFNGNNNNNDLNFFKFCLDKYDTKSQGLERNHLILIVRFGIILMMITHRKLIS